MDIKVLEKDMCHSELIEYLNNTKRYRLLTIEEIEKMNYQHMVNRPEPHKEDNGFAFENIMYCEDTLVLDEDDRVLVYSSGRGELITIPLTYKLKVHLVKTKEYLRLLDSSIVESISINNGNITTWVNDVCNMFKLQSPIEDGDTVMVGKRRKV